MSGLDQRERQAIVDALDKWWRISAGERISWPTLISDILSGHFAPPPEPPAMTAQDVHEAQQRRVMEAAFGHPAPGGVDHLAEAQRTLADPDGPYQLASTHALIDIAQTLRGMRNDMDMRVAFQRMAKP